MDHSPLPSRCSSSAPAGCAAAELVAPHLEARAFYRMRFRILSAHLAHVLAHARLRLALIVILSATLWFGLYLLFKDAFTFLETSIPAPDLRNGIIHAAFNTFFWALTMMLVFSAGVILYGALFRGRDIPLLLTLPARAERVFLCKFQETLLMSSWAFLLLGSPMLLAYGAVTQAPWHYYAMLGPFLLAFVYIPAAVGAVGCLLLVRFFPRGRTVLLVLGGACLLGLAAVALQFLGNVAGRNVITPEWFLDMRARLAITEHRLLPNWWLSVGLLQAAHSRSLRGLSESSMFLLLLVANALALRQVTLAAAMKLYREGFSRLMTHAPGRRRNGRALIDRLFWAATPVLRRPARLLVLKDFRLFRRDPVQWSQFLIFLGLLFIYFFYIRRFSYDVQYAGWINMISCLNLSVVGLLLSTFTTRFIFPMVSLEGRRFWILGLLPLKRKTILWSKFCFAVGGSLLPASLLVLASDLMLATPPLLLAAHQLTCVVLCVGLAGLSVGLGAWFPDLRQESPSRIAAGFGGTLTLVLSTIYILLVVLMTAVPIHFYLGTQVLQTGQALLRPAAAQWLHASIYIGMAASLVTGALATLVPMLLGLRAFKKLEF